MSRAVLLLLVFSFISCQKSINIEAEKQVIQSLIDAVGQAHYNKDADQFYRPNVEEWYDVRQGIVSRNKKSDQIARTQSYLDNMEFHEMTKRNDPIIEISEDGTMASYIGSLTVKGALSNQPVYWIVSWQSVLKKINGEWKIISTANTEADPSTTATVLLNQVRTRLGIDTTDVSSIYALAYCKGPQRSFKTLILSRETDGRMEQVHNQRHSIIKHGKNTSWTHNLKSKTLTEDLSPEMLMFVRGHELHWLSFKPETRYKKTSFKGFKKFEDQQAFHVQSIDNLDRPVNFYYAFDTYLPLGFDIQIDDQGSTVTTLFKDWEKMGDVSIFKKATFIQGNDLFEYDFVDIKVNQTKDQDFENKTALIN